MRLLTLSCSCIQRMADGRISFSQIALWSSRIPWQGWSRPSFGLSDDRHDGRLLLASEVSELPINIPWYDSSGAIQPVTSASIYCVRLKRCCSWPLNPLGQAGKAIFYCAARIFDKGIWFLAPINYQVRHRVEGMHISRNGLSALFSYEHH